MTQFSAKSESGFESLVNSMFGGGPADVQGNKKRHILSWTCDRRPATSAEFDPVAFGTQAAIRDFHRCSHDWQLSGTNAAFSLTELTTDGGVRLTTGATLNDQMIVSPKVLGGVEVSGWGKTRWRPDRAASFGATIRTGADVTNLRIVAGLRLTRVLDSTTDTDHVLFIYDTGHGSSADLWHCNSRRAGAPRDDVANPGSYASTVRANLTYKLGITVDGNRRPHFFIDGSEVAIGQELTDTASFIPVLGIQALSNSARAIDWYDIACGRNLET